MSDDEDSMAEEIRWIEEGIRDARANGIPEEQIAEVEKNLEDIRESLTRQEATMRPREPSALMVFAEQLAARQGTHIPDFDALYERKAELDREMKRWKAGE